MKKVSLSKTNSEELCGICSTNGYLTQECPTILTFQEVLQEQAHMNNAYKRPFTPSFSETYNLNWRNHPNFNWRNGPNANEPQRYSSNPQYALPPVKKSLEETLHAFMEGQAQINKNTMDNYKESKNSIGRIESHLSAREQGTFPSQP